MTKSTIPKNSTRYILYETLRAAMCLEHHSESKKAAGRRHIIKLKEHFGSAYPGSAEEINKFISQHGEFVRKLMNSIQRKRLGLQTSEERILIAYPQLSDLDTEKLSTLLCVVVDSNELFREGNDAENDR